MSALVAYGSSDEEDTSLQDKQTEPAVEICASEEVTETRTSIKAKLKAAKINGDTILATDLPIRPDAPMVGPSLGSSETAELYTQSPSNEEEEVVPLSPYSANRARLRQLTLPPLPSLEIPDSPPGSPSASINAKFAHFLELKKQGVHFHEKLAKSSALKNPSMMQKLLDFSDIDDVAQYSTTISKDLWNPEGFPEWAYKEELAMSQERLLKRKEEEKARSQRESVDFVPATTSGDSIRSVTAGNSAVGRFGPKSTAERVMAGLDRGRSTSPATQAGMKRKTRFET